MKIQTKAQILAIYIGEDDKWRGGLLYPAVVERLKQIGIAGVTVLHAAEGFGVHHKLHASRFTELFEALPIVIECVDVREHIEMARTILDEMLSEGLVTIHDVDAIRYSREAKG